MSIPIFIMMIGVPVKFFTPKNIDFIFELSTYK